MEQTSAVRDLQFMLDQLAHRNPALPRLTITGNFDEPTLEAVMIFQRDYPLPVTGVVDQTTWDAVVTTYQEDFRQSGPPLALRVFPHGEYSTPHGAQDHTRVIAEAIFASLPSSVVNFTRYPGNELFILQQLADIPVHGALDRLTWDFLARLYHALVVRKGLNSGL